MSAKPGDVLTKIAIRVVFDPYFERVIIGSHLERLPRENRQVPITYRVKEALSIDYKPERQKNGGRE